jgi:hypothetical protein
MPAVILRDNTTMPTICVKCGKADAHTARLEDFRYRPLWARPLGNLGALFDRKASFCFWLCEPCNAKWKYATPASIATFLLGIAAWLGVARYVLPVVLPLVSGPLTWVIGLGWFVGFIPWLYALDFVVDLLVYQPLIVSVRGIDKEGMVTLHGVHASCASAIGKS